MTKIMVLSQAFLFGCSQGISNNVGSFGEKSKKPQSTFKKLAKAASILSFAQLPQMTTGERKFEYNGRRNLQALSDDLYSKECIVSGFPLGNTAVSFDSDLTLLSNGDAGLVKQVTYNNSLSNGTLTVLSKLNTSTGASAAYWAQSIRKIGADLFPIKGVVYDENSNKFLYVGDSDTGIDLISLSADDGSLVWSKEEPGSSNKGNAIIGTLANNTFAVVGESGASNILMAIDGDGNKLWKTSFSTINFTNISPKSLTQLTTGDFLTGSIVQSTNDPSKKYYQINKFNSTGFHNITKQYLIINSGLTPNMKMAIPTIESMPDGKFAVVGVSEFGAVPGQLVPFLGKFDSNLDNEWARTLGVNLNAVLSSGMALSLSSTPQGDLWITVYKKVSNISSSSSEDVNAYLKFSSNGTLLFAKSIDRDTGLDMLTVAKINNASELFLLGFNSKNGTQHFLKPNIDSPFDFCTSDFAPNTSIIGNSLPSIAELNVVYGDLSTTTRSTSVSLTPVSLNCENKCILPPTTTPSIYPTSEPTLSTSTPTLLPTVVPTNMPTLGPTISSQSPTLHPSSIPSLSPSVMPTSQPSFGPTVDPTKKPTVTPSHNPTANPTAKPSSDPTKKPTLGPSRNPTGRPSVNPTTTASPTKKPSNGPTMRPSLSPSIQPSTHPSSYPSVIPTHDPTSQPTTMMPTLNPTKKPTNTPTVDLLSSSNSTSDDNYSVKVIVVFSVAVILFVVSIAALGYKIF